MRCMYENNTFTGTFYLIHANKWYMNTKYKSTTICYVRRTRLLNITVLPIMLVKDYLHILGMQQIFGKFENFSAINHGNTLTRLF